MPVAGGERGEARWASSAWGVALRGVALRGGPPAGRAVMPHPRPAAAEPAQCSPCCPSRRAASPWRHPLRPLRPLRWTARAALRVRIVRVPTVCLRRRPRNDRVTLSCCA